LKGKSQRENGDVILSLSKGEQSCPATLDDRIAIRRAVVLSEVEGRPRKNVNERRDCSGRASTSSARGHEILKCRSVGRTSKIVRASTGSA
jgi:hypothetical protein